MLTGSTDKEVEVIQVVRTTLLRRGAGDIPTNDPIRRITQYWSMDGQLLAEVDPHLQKMPVKVTGWQIMNDG